MRISPYTVFAPALLERAAEILRERAGLVFDHARRSVLEAGVRAGFQRSNLHTPEEYVDRLGHDQDLLDGLLAGVTIGETYFFRDSDQFALLRDRIFPELFARSRRSGNGEDAPLRIWSAACASGEEPYSLAILLHQLGWLSRTRILGTDISRPLLHRAHQARYAAWSLRGVAENVVATYFHRQGNRYTLIPAIRDAVDFRYLNLADTGYPSVTSGAWGMDLILCRNALIYFAPDQVFPVTSRLLGSLVDGGWLMLGSTDPVLNDPVGARVEITSAGLVYRRGRRSNEWAAIPDDRGHTTPALPAGAPSPSVSQSRPAAPAPSTVKRPPVASAAQEAERTHTEDDARARAMQCYAARDYRAATAAAAAALVDHPDDTKLWMLQINALANNGQLDEAERRCREARDRHGLCADLTVLHAFLLLEAGHHREAAMTARQALYLDSELSVAHLALGTALVRDRDTTGAERAFRNAARLLAALPADMPVPGAGDVSAGRLTALARTQLVLLRGSTS